MALMQNVAARQDWIRKRQMALPVSGTDYLTDRAANDGLVWAIRCVPDQKPVALAHDEVERRLNGHPNEKPGWIWLHYDIVHSAVRAKIEAIPSLPEEVRDMLADTDYGTHIDGSPDLVWGALPAFDDSVASNDDENVSSWRFVMAPDLLITTRRSPVTVLGVAYRALDRGINAADGPIALVERALREFTENVRRQITVLDDELDRAEDVLLRIDPSSDLGHISGIVGKVRRRQTELRRIIAPLHRMFRNEDLELPEWAEDELRDRAERQTHAALDDLIALQERARSLQDELASSQAEETNRRLYIVSVATTLMLPATFVTGFFGMNTGGMFLSSGRFGTVEAGIVCLVFMFVAWVLLKLLRLL